MTKLIMTPPVAPRKGIQDGLAFWISRVDSGFQVLDSSVLSGTWILDSNSECMELRIP